MGISEYEKNSEIRPINVGHFIYTKSLTLIFFLIQS